VPDAIYLVIVCTIDQSAAGFAWISTAFLSFTSDDEHAEISVCRILDKQCFSLERKEEKHKQTRSVLCNSL